MGTDQRTALRDDLRLRFMRERSGSRRESPQTFLHERFVTGVIRMPAFRMDGPRGRSAGFARRHPRADAGLDRFRV